MNLRDAKDQVAREHPELRGTERMLAIKALRDRPEPGATGDAPASNAATKGAAPSGDRYCWNCDQPVKPMVSNGWGKVATFIALLQLGALLVAVVACFTSVDVGVGFRALVSWPAAIHPVGVGVVAAVAALVAAVAVSGSLTQRAERNGICPKCRSVLAGQQSSTGA